MKILISVLTYLDGGVYSKFYEVQNETWNSLHEENIETFFYIGNGDKKEIKNHFVINDTPETVPNEGRKFVNFLELTYDLDYDFIFQTNSSSYVDKKLLKQWLSDKPKERFYSGVRGFFNGRYYASGCGFTISKDVASLIIQNQNKWVHGTEDDATLGNLLEDLGISLTVAPRYDVTNPNQIDKNYFHYRLKTYDRNHDVLNMRKIFELKTKN